MWIQLLLPPITPKPSKKKEKKKKTQAIKGCRGKFIGLQPGPMVTLSICVQRWTATFPQCVSTCPTVWGCIYMTVFHYTLCAWIIASRHVSTSVPIHAFFPWKFVHFISSFARVDEVTKWQHAFLFLPTSRQLPAAFLQSLKPSCLPVASIITPPIRTKRDEEYQWVKRVRVHAATTAWTLIYMCVDKTSSWAWSQLQRWNHSWAMEYNSYSIQIQLHTIRQ